MTTQVEKRGYVHIPETVSKEAQEFMANLPDPHVKPAFPDAADIEGWKKVQAAAEADGLQKSEPLLKRYPHTVAEATLGGIPILDIRPKDWQESKKLLLYTHGGAHTMYSAKSMLGRAVVAAHETKLRIISVDYTLAPHAKYQQISDEVIRVIQALIDQGQRLEDLALYGDSSGGGLAAAVTLKMRDKGLGLPNSLVMASAWVDITPSGDTETTLHDADPNQLYEKHSVFAAAAYADPADQKHPYASPVYGDFSKGFCPTLIQGGLKETLLSGFVRFYQALDQAGIPVKLDLYEGMVHNFQDRIPDAPESILARRKMSEFLHKHLG